MKFSVQLFELPHEKQRAMSKHRQQNIKLCEPKLRVRSPLYECTHTHGSGYRQQISVSIWTRTVETDPTPCNTSHCLKSLPTPPLHVWNLQHSTLFERNQHRPSPSWGSPLPSSHAKKQPISTNCLPQPQLVCGTFVEEQSNRNPSVPDHVPWKPEKIKKIGLERWENTNWELRSKIFRKMLFVSENLAAPSPRISSKRHARNHSCQRSTSRDLQWCWDCHMNAPETRVI
jgi:hypothetical protein